MCSVGETILEIDLQALAHNYKYLRNLLKPETKFLSVTKAFAYGSHASAIALKLQELGADYFAVAYVAEGVKLREAGITKPILVLHPQPVNFSILIAHQLEPSLYSKNILEAFTKAAEKCNAVQYPVHLKFNTGLNRLGFKENDVDWIISKTTDQNYIKPMAIFSHLAESDEITDTLFTQKQLQCFNKIVKALEQKLGLVLLKHILNTSGIMNYATNQYNMVRSGIGLYGYGNHPKIDQELKPVATLKTIISQIHYLDTDDSVGYNRAYKVTKPTTIATLPLGHADGIGRQYGKGKTFVSVQGTKALIIGNVCMDMIMIDITGIACKEGDEVIIFGKTESAEDFANTASTISYELLTGISQRVKRRIIS